MDRDRVRENVTEKTARARYTNTNSSEAIERNDRLCENSLSFRCMRGRRLSGSLNSPVTLKNRDSSAEDPVFLGNGLHHFPYSENIHHSPEVVCQYCQTRLGADVA